MFYLFARLDIWSLFELLSEQCIMFENRLFENNYSSKIVQEELAQK
jgi:hypothetical protein